MDSRILVINDDQAILDLFQLILEPEGYKVHLSTLPFENIHEVEQLAPSLIILDLKFGHHAQGLLLLQQLKMYRPSMHIPVILCTAALAIMREQEETFRHKGIPVIYKPFDVDELLQVVRQLLPPSLEK